MLPPLVNVFVKEEMGVEHESFASQIRALVTEDFLTVHKGHLHSVVTKYRKHIRDTVGESCLVCCKGHLLPISDNAMPNREKPDQ